MDMLKYLLLGVLIQRHRKPPRLAVNEADLGRKKLQQGMQLQRRMRQLLASLFRVHTRGRLHLGRI